MLEIFAIMVITSRIGNKAKVKGYSEGYYKLLVIISWICGEFTGAFIGAAINNESVLLIYICALMGAITGVSIVYRKVCGLALTAVTMKKIDPANTKPQPVPLNEVNGAITIGDKLYRSLAKEKGGHFVLDADQCHP